MIFLCVVTEALHVYKNKSDAFELVRRYKSARFKMFHNRQDAVSFALRGAEPLDVPDGHDCTYYYFLIHMYTFIIKII